MNRNDQLFSIDAYIDQPPTPGSLFPGKQIIAMGDVTGVPIPQNGGFSVHYVIRNVPFDTTVKIEVSAEPGAFSLPGGSSVSITQISGPVTVTLTSQHLKETDVNFEMFYEEQLR